MCNVRVINNKSYFWPMCHLGRPVYFYPYQHVYIFEYELRGELVFEEIWTEGHGLFMKLICFPCDTDVNRLQSVK